LLFCYGVTRKHACSSFMYCTHYWCSAQNNLQNVELKNENFFYSYWMKLGTENHWVVVIIITDAQQHKM
jgi:hypothetical protein